MHVVLLKRKRRKKIYRTLHTSSEPEIEKPPEDNNDVSISDAETQSSNEHSPEVCKVLSFFFFFFFLEGQGASV